MDPNKPCVFPYIDLLDGKKYYGCVRKSCATKVDENGTEIDNFWGYCDPNCLTHEETKSWKKDETFKMTLQYKNTVFWPGLELYGYLLASIVLLGLLLTTLLPAIGKLIKKSQFTIIIIYIHSSNSDYKV